MLATLEVPFDEEAAAFAVDAAVESGQPLIVANVVEIPLAPMRACWGTAARAGEDAEAGCARPPSSRTRSVAGRAAAVGSPHPVAALLELVAERRPGSSSSARTAPACVAGRYERAARRVRERASCLVWTATGLAHRVGPACIGAPEVVVFS